MSFACSEHPCTGLQGTWWRRRAGTTPNSRWAAAWWRSTSSGSVTSTGTSSSTACPGQQLLRNFVGAGYSEGLAIFVWSESRLSLPIVGKLTFVRLCNNCTVRPSHFCLAHVSWSPVEYTTRSVLLSSFFPLILERNVYSNAAFPGKIAL